MYRERMMDVIGVLCAFGAFYVLWWMAAVADQAVTAAAM